VRADDTPPPGAGLVTDRLIVPAGSPAGIGAVIFVLETKVILRVWPVPDPAGISIIAEVGTKPLPITVKVESEP
jgi:hypothetical protein